MCKYLTQPGFWWHLLVFAHPRLLMRGECFSTKQRSGPEFVARVSFFLLLHRWVGLLVSNFKGAISETRLWALQQKPGVLLSFALVF